ncbi:MAG TPA: hypothetical protein VK853_11515 [Ilumatobacteraceae bacterium]|nr:hypothetical protein [Ilumatobacteraceae bacterium]
MRDTTSRVPPAVRHFGRALTVALLAAVLAAAGASRLGGETSATSRVAVSDEVGWPFYTSARDRLLEVALDPDVQNGVRDALGADDATLELDAEPTGGEISVDLTARSPDSALATQAANLYAEDVVTRGTQEALVAAEQGLEDLRQQLEVIDARAAANEVELLRIGDALDALGDAPAEGSRRLLESQLRRIETALAEDARRRAQIVQELPSAEAALGAASSDYEFVRAARSPDGDILSDAVAMALLAGIPLFLIGLGASVLWDQTLGVVRRPRDVRWATDAPVFTIDYEHDDRIVDPSPLTRRMVRQQIPGSVWMLTPTGRSPKVALLSSALVETVGHRLTVATLPGQPVRDETDVDRTASDTVPPTGPGQRAHGDTSADGPDSAVAERMPAELLTEARAEHVAPPPRVTGSSSGRGADTAVSGAVVTMLRNGVRLPRLRRAIRDLELEGIPVEGVVIFGPRQ